MTVQPDADTDDKRPVSTDDQVLRRAADLLTGDGWVETARQVRAIADGFTLDDVLEIEADPAGVTQTIGHDEFGRPVTVSWELDVLEQALAELVSRGDDRIRMPGNGSPVLLECDLVTMQQAVRRAQERER